MPDPFEVVLDLEQNFHQEGYDQGLADGREAGLIEGKIFGIEKGFQKAETLGKLHGRALFWKARTSPRETREPEQRPSAPQDVNLKTLIHHIGLQPNSARLKKHLELLLSATDGTSLSYENSDAAVAEFEERITRATAKAKVISNIVGEPLEVSHSEQVGIEGSQGLSARR